MPNLGFCPTLSDQPVCRGAVSKGNSLEPRPAVVKWWAEQNPSAVPPSKERIHMYIIYIYMYIILHVLYYVYIYIYIYYTQWKNMKSNSEKMWKKTYQQAVSHIHICRNVMCFHLFPGLGSAITAWNARIFLLQRSATWCSRALPWWDFDQTQPAQKDVIHNKSRQQTVVHFRWSMVAMWFWSISHAIHCSQIYISYIALYYIKLCYIVFYHITLYYIISYHIMSYHIISYYIILYHTIL